MVRSNLQVQVDTMDNAELAVSVQGPKTNLPAKVAGDVKNEFTKDFLCLCLSRELQLWGRPLMALMCWYLPYPGEPFTFSVVSLEAIDHIINKMFGKVSVPGVPFIAKIHNNITVSGQCLADTAVGKTSVSSIEDREAAAEAQKREIVALVLPNVAGDETKDLSDQQQNQQSIPEVLAVHPSSTSSQSQQYLQSFPAAYQQSNPAVPTVNTMRSAVCQQYEGYFHHHGRHLQHRQDEGYLQHHGAFGKMNDTLMVDAFSTSKMKDTYNVMVDAFSKIKDTSFKDIMRDTFNSMDTTNSKDTSSTMGDTINSVDNTISNNTSNTMGDTLHTMRDTSSTMEDAFHRKKDTSR
jgi:hypothetical protein